MLYRNEERLFCVHLFLNSFLAGRTPTPWFGCLFDPLDVGHIMAMTNLSAQNGKKHKILRNFVFSLNIHCKQTANAAIKKIKKFE